MVKLIASLIVIGTLTFFTLAHADESARDNPQIDWQSADRATRANTARQPAADNRDPSGQSPVVKDDDVPTRAP